MDVRISETFENFSNHLGQPNIKEVTIWPQVRHIIYNSLTPLIKSTVDTSLLILDGGVRCDS